MEIKLLLDALSKIPWKVLGKVLQKITRNRIVTIGLCLLLLSASVLLSFKYFSRSIRYETIVSKTLQAELMPTPQKYKGLEAFIMSMADVDPSPDKGLGELSFTNDFTQALKLIKGKLQEVIKYEALAKELALCEAPGNQSQNCNQLREQIQRFQNSTGLNPELKPYISPGANDGMILTDSDENGYLFLPLHILRPSIKNENKSKLRYESIGGKNKIIDQLMPQIQNNIEIMREMIITRHLADILKTFTGYSITEKPASQPPKNLNTSPAQVYIITKDGLNRIFNKDRKPQRWYGSQFSATTFFPSRPYFWEAFRQDKGRHIVSQSLDSIVPVDGEKLADYFYISKPYMDLGGNGIVVTLAHGIQIDDLPQFAICFDLPFRESDSQNGVDLALRNLIRDFEGVAARVKGDLSVEKMSVTCTYIPEKGEEPSEVQKDLVSSIQSNLQEAIKHSQYSEAFGNIQVLDPVNAKEGKALEVSVPVLAGAAGEDILTGTFFVFRLDLADYYALTRRYALAAATAFGLLTMLLAYIAGSTIQRGNEFEEALDKVSKVMQSSPTAFVRLNSKDLICDFSKGFCEKLGYSQDDSASMEKLKKTTLESLCADQKSIDEYKSVQEKRKKGEHVGDYELRLKAQNGSIVPVKVYSAAIPSTDLDVMPETFGILVDDDRQRIAQPAPNL